MNRTITPLCDGGNCPSKKNCQRYTAPRPMEFNRAALWLRREAGANACDMVAWANPVTTFKEAAE